MNFSALSYYIEQFADFCVLSPEFDTYINDLQTNEHLSNRDREVIFYLAEQAREEALHLAALYFKHRAAHIESTHPTYYEHVEHAARMI